MRRVAFCIAVATIAACSSPPTDHLGGIKPADVVNIALAAGLTCEPEPDLPQGEVYRTKCEDMDPDSPLFFAHVWFGGSTTDTVSSITAGPPTLGPAETALDLADAVADLDYEGGDPDALKEWIRTQAAGITTDLERDFGPARAMFVGGSLFLDSVGAID